MRTLRIIDPEDGDAPSKTMSLRCLHKHQHTSAMPVQKSCRSSFPPCQDRNQSTNVVSCVGRQSTLSHQRKQVSHTALANTQSSSKCAIDSWA
jgi:hypothetical protein